MKDHLIILFQSYTPSTAPTSRLLSYLNSLESFGINGKVYFFKPDEHRSKLCKEYKYIDIVNLWETLYSKNKLFEYILYILNIFRVIINCRHNGNIYVYGLSDVVRILSYVKGINVYQEITESPEINLPGTRLNPSLKEHYRICSRIKGLFVISQNLKAFYASKGIPENRIHVVNMTVDSTRFNNLEKQNINERYIAYCGTISNTKDGVDQLIKAFALLHEVYKDIKLYIIGAIPENLNEDRNYALIKELRTIENVVFTGLVPSNKLPQLLKNATILALARPDNQQAKYGFPTKLGEYLLTKNPVVVTSVGEIPNFFRDGVDACICEPNNPQAFANKLKWLIENPDTACSIGEKGSIVAKINFDALIETRKLINAIYGTK